MKPTLGQVFTLSLLGLAAVLAILFYVVLEGSRRTILESAERSRQNASREIGDRVAAFLAKAPATVEQVQFALDRGLIHTSDPAGLEAALFGALLAAREIGEITLTYGHKLGYDEDGDIQLAPAGRGQFSVGRKGGAAGEVLWSRHVHKANGAFLAEEHELRADPQLRSQQPTRTTTESIPDPTLHLTFLTPARQEHQGQLLWSDLHWSQIDDARPADERRVEMSVQEAVNDAGGEFLGVLRVGLLAQQLDRAVRLTIAPGQASDPHRIFLCDSAGHLITRGESTDRLQDFDDDLRIAPEAIAEPLQSALQYVKSHGSRAGSRPFSGEFRVGSDDYLATIRPLPETQGWILGIVAPKAFYLGKLASMRDRLLVAALGLSVVMLGGGSVLLRTVKRAQEQITRESLRMKAFEFSPAAATSPFRDVAEVLESLEKAKTAMRAMGKYAPVELVRQLYRNNIEPVLGGELMEVSVLFTDVKGFTTLTEISPPDQLAIALGRYLETMARVIQQETGGTIDKFIGDAIMSIWNAPGEIVDHARQACRAALRCEEEGRILARSADWDGVPPFETRFGLHCGRALVGHFGAPDRMNYTAMGDAINLASRLEGLNKQYGTTILVSESIEEQTRDFFIFRQLDIVAVKGKNQPIKIYELLAERGKQPPPVPIVDYETALAAYAARDFERAARLLSQHPTDPPSTILLERCRKFLQEPPPSDWRGVYYAAEK